MSITDPIIGRAVRRDSRGAASNEPTQPEAKIASRRRKSVGPFEAADVFCGSQQFRSAFRRDFSTDRSRLRDQQ